jgi:hypothetical protein
MGAHSTATSCKSRKAEAAAAAAAAATAAGPTAAVPLALTLSIVAAHPQQQRLCLHDFWLQAEFSQDAIQHSVPLLTQPAQGEGMSRQAGGTAGQQRAGEGTL